MKTEILVKKEVNIKTLEINAGVRYWEDASVNDIEDVDGKLMPFRKGDCWCPIIDIDTGIIKDWPKDTRAVVHYKICDAGSYFLKDEKGNIVLEIDNNYVPNDLIPGEYGDYIILSINESGKINEWNLSPCIDDFLQSDD